MCIFGFSVCFSLTEEQSGVKMIEIAHLQSLKPCYDCHSVVKRTVFY